MKLYGEIAHYSLLIHPRTFSTDPKFELKGNSGKATERPIQILGNIRSKRTEKKQAAKELLAISVAEERSLRTVDPELYKKHEFNRIFGEWTSFE